MRLKAFGIKPCVSQIQVAAAQLECNSDVVYIAGTGSGKTLTFWMPMLFENDSITIHVTSLNILGEQTAAQLNKLNIPAINLTAANISPGVFAVCHIQFYIILALNTLFTENKSRRLSFNCCQPRGPHQK